MAKRRKGNPINGIVVIDKPSGVSSNSVVQTVKRIFNAQKAGHTGALDPLATGMLPVCLGEATKFSQYSLEADKAYQTVATLGIRTDTSDSDGAVVEIKPVDVNPAQIIQALERFSGRIMQTPSIFSALKYEGKPLYYYARKGIDVPRPTREITIYGHKILEFTGDNIHVYVECSKGTYIRTLIDDLGQILGCGAHVSALRRVWISGFKGSPMHSLEDLQRMVTEQDIDSLHSILLPMDYHLEHIPVCKLTTVQAVSFTNGMMVPAPKLGLEISKDVRVYDAESNLFLGMAFVNQEGKLQPKRVVVQNNTAV